MEEVIIRGLTMCMMKSALAAGTTTTYSTTGTTHFCIDGAAYTVAAATNAATPTTDVNTAAAFTAIAASKGCSFVWGYNAAGAVKVAQGPIVDLSTDADGANAKFTKVPPFPNFPADFCPIAYLITKVGASGAAWTMGSSNLAGPPSNVLHTFQSVAALPSRPQVD